MELKEVVILSMQLNYSMVNSIEELEKLDIDSLTPLEALTKLYELQKKAREGIEHGNKK